MSGVMLEWDGEDNNGKKCVFLCFILFCFFWREGGNKE